MRGSDITDIRLGLASKWQLLGNGRENCEVALPFLPLVWKDSCVLNNLGLWFDLLDLYFSRF